NRGGLNRLRDGKFTNFTSIEGLPDDVTNCVYQDQQDRIWIGSLSGGVSYLENDTFQIINQESGLSSNHIRSVLEDQNGDIWLATYSNGINRIQYSLNKTDPPILHYTMNDGLAGNIVRSLFRCKDGGILVGTNGGLSKFDGTTFVNYTRQIGLSENSILGLYEDSKGNIWIGTDGGGLNCLRTDNTIISYTNSNGLASNLVFTMYEDKEGAIWVGSRRGLSRILDGEIVNLYAKDGLAQEAIHGIIEDDYGRIWLSSNSGVFWVNKKELDTYADQKSNLTSKKNLPPFQSTLYQEDDGMKSSDCATAAQPSILKDHQGFIWFPTTEGVTRIDPAHLKINYITPKVRIKRVLIDNEEYPLQEDQLVLEPGKTKFEIDYAALSFLAPAKVKYRYRLEGSGFREEWVEAENRRNAYYNNLPPGAYTFRVQAANNDGVWNEEGAAISFYLRPFFYQTRLFYIVSIILILSLAFGIYYWRVRSLERSKKALEKGIEESTQKIRSQYHELTQYAEELSTINNIVTTINKEHKFEKVLESLLDQGLLLFSKSNKGIFIVQNPDTKVFRLAASQGYDQDSFEKLKFTKDELVEYCSTGLQLEKEIFKLQPSINLKPLMKSYRPKSSLAMQILENEELRGILFFDNTSGFQDVQMSDILKLTRFKEQAVSAFVKARILRELENKNYQVETSFRKISDSIRYARRIQRAILPSEQEIENSGVFEDSFIFYKPRDIVSGDFYWYAETSPEPIFSLGEKSEGDTSVFKGFDDIKKIITAVDCTGHGVPGAFMTVIGNDLLNSIVNEDKITRAHHILDRLDKNVKMYLKQDEGGQSRDGMDMSLLVIDEINQKIEFAGAKNPLYYITNGELKQIKASKHPIGGSQIKNKVFTSAFIDYKQGDIFYLFSDGFPDQFGGPDDRKFGSKRFRELLIHIHQLPLSEQKQFLVKEFESWKGHNKQTDDILVLGLKF
ncbi:MAG: two-component regulator propeller domain-containing protein, partial [Bacteroidota bacterium]